MPTCLSITLALCYSFSFKHLCQLFWFYFYFFQRFLNLILELTFSSITLSYFAAKVIYSVCLTSPTIHSSSVSSDYSFLFSILILSCVLMITWYNYFFEFMKHSNHAFSPPNTESRPSRTVVLRADRTLESQNNPCILKPGSDMIL